MKGAVMWLREQVEYYAGPWLVPILERQRHIVVDGVHRKFSGLARRGDTIIHETVFALRLALHGVPGRRVVTGKDYESAKALFPIACTLGLPEMVRISKKERSRYNARRGNERKHEMRFVTEPLEAIVAAIELHSGEEQARTFVFENIVGPIALDGVVA